jgi:hypothetical protein
MIITISFSISISITIIVLLCTRLLAQNLNEQELN